MVKKKRKLICMVLGLILIITNNAPVLAAKYAELTSVKGVVTVQRSGSEKPTKTFRGMTLQEGDIVTTGANSAATLTIEGNKTIQAASNSSFVISKLEGFGSDARSVFTLLYGEVYSDVKQKKQYYAHP